MFSVNFFLKKRLSKEEDGDRPDDEAADDLTKHTCA